MWQCFLFYKVKDKIPNDCLKNLYIMLLFIHMYYMELNYMQINTTKSFLNRLIILNNKILRILQRKSISTNVYMLYRNYNTLPVEILHNRQLLLFIHKCVHVHYKELFPNLFQNYITESGTILL